jgi:hypothetical protein
MKLPEIEYQAPVETTSDDVRRLDEEQRRSFGIIAEGMQRYSAELVKTENQQASADLAEGLATIETDLVANRYVTTEEVRQAFGGEIPAELKEKVVGKGVDPAGEPHEFDRDDIPTWEVAGALYDRRAQQLLEVASRRIGMPGWRSEFATAAKTEIAARKMRVARMQTQAMDADLRARQDTVVETFVRAREFDKAAAAIASSRLYSPAEKEAREGAIEHARQLQPLEDRLLVGVQSTDDVLEVGKLVGRLESGEGLERLEDKERSKWKLTLEGLVSEYERRTADAAANQFRAADEDLKNRVFGAWVKGRGGALSFSLLSGAHGNVSADAYAAAAKFIESTQKREERKTSAAKYIELNLLARNDPAAFVARNLLLDANDLSAMHLQHFSDLQRTISTGGAGGRQGFVGAQEELTRVLREFGFGLDAGGKPLDNKNQAELKRLALIHTVVDEELERATLAKGGPLEIRERNALIREVAAREMRLSAANAGSNGRVRAGLDRADARLELLFSGGDEEVPDEFLNAVRQSSIRRAEGAEGSALRRTWRGYKAAEENIFAAWDAEGGKRALTPEVALEVFDIVETQGAAIRAALEKHGKSVDARNIARVAVRGYLRGGR